LSERENILIIVQKGIAKVNPPLFKIEEVKEKNFQEIPSPCRYCLYWQKTGAFGEEMLKPSMEKENRNGSVKWLKLLEVA
jgi:hypothetical protein